MQAVAVVPGHALLRSVFGAEVPAGREREDGSLADAGHVPVDVPAHLRAADPVHREPTHLRLELDHDLCAVAIEAVRTGGAEVVTDRDEVQLQQPYPLGAVPLTRQERARRRGRRRACRRDAAAGETAAMHQPADLATGALGRDDVAVFLLHPGSHED